MLNLFQHPSPGTSQRMNDERQPCVYILASGYNGTLYVGVTSSLVRRVWQHRTGAVPGFTSRYKVKRLVHFELFGDMGRAIAREKQIKNWRRQWKINLIETGNPDWADLASGLGLQSLDPGPKHDGS
ncbi:hypothetical protein GCM10011371_26310 [Novosphingobium marinum]|nr:GIY-YIG nuclease family protein [Novosphingobium marinum]GGC37534.1 hypothetical protein GCM10011371_26310 [Novosphingobium marinum]